MFAPVYTVALALLLPAPLWAADEPVLDTLSFADEVVSFTEGSPAAKNKSNNSPALALGPPEKGQPSLTLGCGGELIVRFSDNALVDVAGPDLYIFEIGPDIEATSVDISSDGRNWIAIGRVAGATAALDIHPFIRAKQNFNFVRLHDLKQSCNSDTPGADIAAIAAIGSVARYQFSGDLLFDFDQATLKPAAKELLQQWLTVFNGKSGQLQINGHTDQFGREEYNLILSQKRAEAVATFLAHQIRPGIAIKTHGLGETQPLVIAHSKKQAARNRRVEIIYFPN